MVESNSEIIAENSPELEPIVKLEGVYKIYKQGNVAFNKGGIT